VRSGAHLATKAVLAELEAELLQRVFGLRVAQTVVLKVLT
jgi:hypothetical protein